MLFNVIHYESRKFWKVNLLKELTQDSNRIVQAIWKLSGIVPVTLSIYLILSPFSWCLANVDE